MKFRLFGTEIYISFLFFAIIAFLIATDKTGYCIPTVFSVLLHESAHLIAMWICDCQPKTIKLVPASVRITRGFSRKNYGEIFIALSGPIANILLFCSLFINYKMTGNGFSFDCAIINLAIAFFNLLPVSGLDGGIILKFILSRALGDINRAETVIKIINIVLAVAIFALGIWLIKADKFNISVFIVGIYILVCAFLRE